MRQAGAVVYEALMAVKQAVRPGVTTWELDRIAADIIKKRGATPSFLGYNGFPATLCTSVDDEVVHGIPSRDVVLKEGSIVGIDCGAIVGGFHGDSAITVGVGEISPEAQRLIAQTEASFWKGAWQARAGGRVQDISSAVQAQAEGAGFCVVRMMCGHGVGENLHEDPEVPNFGHPGRGERLRAGMTIAVEPMIVTGEHACYQDKNGWTIRTRDRGLCAHYEHSIAIQAEGPPLILTLPSGPPPGVWEAAP